MCPYKEQQLISSDDSELDDEVFEATAEAEMEDSDDTDGTYSDMSDDHEEADDQEDAVVSPDESDDPQASVLQISSDTRQIRAELERLIDELSNGIPLDFIGLENLAEELQDLLHQIDERLPRLCPCHAWQSIVSQLHSAVEELRDALLIGFEQFGKREE